MKSLLAKLARAGIFKQFYLAGGTGLALLLGHRRSVDLGFFSSGNWLDFEGRRSLFSLLKPLPGWRLIEARDGTVLGQVGRVRVSFF